MADVKWIKINTDMFDNKKIKHIRKMPEGNSIVLIWVMLLTMAGRCNDGGLIYLTRNIPYTTKMLADELDFEESVIQLAMDVLFKLGMIVCDDDYYAIAGWDEHQNIDGMDKIREQARKRMSNYRSRKMLSENKTQCNVTSDVTSNVTVTQRYAIEEEGERELEREKEAESKLYSQLCLKFGKEYVDQKIERAKRYPGTNMDTVAEWCEKDSKNPKNKFNDFPQRESNITEIEKILLAGQA